MAFDLEGRKEASRVALRCISALVVDKRPVPEVLFARLLTVTDNELANSWLTAAGYVPATDGFCGYTPAWDSQPLRSYKSEPRAWSFGGMNFTVRQSGGISDHLRFDDDE